MKGMYRAAVAGCVTAALAASIVVSSASAGPLRFDPPKAFQHYMKVRTYAPQQVIVRYTDGAGAQRTARVRARARAASATRLPVRGMHLELLDLRADQTVGAVVARLNRTPGVLYAEPNYYRRALALPNDPQLATQWGLHNTGQSIELVEGVADSDIDAAEAWDITTGAASVKVAVLDTGILWEHSDLRDNLHVNTGEYGGGKETNKVDDDANGYVDDWRGWDFAGRNGRRPDNNPLDLALHGTHVAGTIGAVGNNGIGTSGVAWDVGLVPLKFLNDDGYGTVAASIEGYEYARENGIRVVNGSFGGPEQSRAEFDAIKGSPNTLFVFAAGNEGADNDAVVNPADDGLLFFLGGPSYPAAYARNLANVMSVAASTSKDGRAHYTNYGDETVDLAAPGTTINSTYRATPLYEETFLDDTQGRWVRGGTKTDWSWNQQLAVSSSNDLQLTFKCGPVKEDDRDEEDREESLVCRSDILGSYRTNTDSWLRMAEPMSLTGRTDCLLNLAEFHQLQKDRDYMALEASTDNVHWARVGKPFTGGNLGLFTRSLKKYDNAAQLWLRMRLTSDGRVGGLGSHSFALWVDHCQPNQYEYEYSTGTSMAAPHVTGAAALVLAQYPSADPAWVREVLNQGTDKLDTWAGRTRSGGRLNVRGALNVAPTLTHPVAFNGTYPKQTVAVSDRTPTLRWRLSGSDTGITTYEVYVDERKIADMASRESAATVPSALSLGRHTWRVEAVDRDGHRTATATRSFTVKREPTVTLRQLSASGSVRACGTPAKLCRYGRGELVRLRGSATPAGLVAGAPVQVRYYLKNAKGRWVLKQRVRTRVRGGTFAVQAKLGGGAWRVIAIVGERSLTVDTASRGSYLVVR